MGRLLHLYLPLAFTFLLMSGSSPIINKGIGQLPDQTIGWAAFVNAMGLSLFLYSPCFIVRDAAQKFIRGKTSYRRALVFYLTVSTVCTAILAAVALTPILDDLLLRGLIRLKGELFEAVKQGMLAFTPVPTLVTLRGIHQGAHITNDSPRWIGIGTAVRFAVIILFVFQVGVRLGLPGAVMGGLAFACGVGVEMIVAVVTVRRSAPWLKEDDPEDRPPATYRELWAFNWPLFLANAMGVFLQPLSAAIANGAILDKTSGAAYGVVRSFTWFFASTLFAMQAMALAKADSMKNLKRLLVFEMIPAGAITGMILVAAFVTPAREWLLREFFEARDEGTIAFVAATLPFALVLPVIMALRSTARGLLMRSGRTLWVTLASLAGLLVLLKVNASGVSSVKENGATIAYMAWMGALAVDLVVLLIALARVGLETCVTESRATPRLAEEQVEGGTPTAR